jgi:hypothetical protein
MQKAKVGNPRRPHWVLGKNKSKCKNAKLRILLPSPPLGERGDRKAVGEGVSTNTNTLGQVRIMPRGFDFCLLRFAF